jgi:hypothetical protein
LVFEQLSLKPAIVPTAEPQVFYRALTLQECQCLATKAYGASGIVDQEKQAVSQQASGKGLQGCGQAKVLQLKEDILKASSRELRNTAAGMAETLFFRLLEAEALADLERDGLRVLSEALDRMKGLKDQGIKAKDDYEALLRQQVEMQEELVRLEINIDSLNTELVRMLGLDMRCCSCRDRLRPVVGRLRLCDKPVDCEAAVTEGLARRAELFLLQRLIDDLDLTTLAVVRKALQSVNPMVGLGERHSPCPALYRIVQTLLCNPAGKQELQARRQQLEQHRASRVEAISLSISQIVESLNRRACLVALTQESVHLHSTRVRDLETKAARGLISNVEVAKAQLELLKAKVEVVKEAAAWERTLVELHVNQGVLDECCEEGPPVRELPSAPSPFPGL